MNTDKEFVPYQQSLDMKELGFDEPSISGYSYPNSDKLLSQAILYQQAFRWFREKYKIRFFIQSGMSDLGEFFKVIFPIGEVRSMSYPTYEEAEQACLVKLIDIVKKQNLKG
jgi:hypothetical protein